jgi:class 3 adenylate cyclase
MVFRGSGSGGAPLTYLDVHCGVGVGEMAGVHIGDDRLHREYVYIGNPIAQATKVCNIAKKGQVVISRKVFTVNVLSWSGVIAEPFTLQGLEYFVITDGGETKLDEKKLSAYNKGIRSTRSRGVTDHVDGLEVQALMEYRRLMSLYVHPAVVSNDVAASGNFQSSRTNSVMQERHKDDAKLRSCYVVFINPQISVDLSGEDYLKSAHMLNDILNLTTRELNRYNGHMRQLIVDDKGLVIIATFGLCSSSFPNMVAERALPTMVVIHGALQIELGVDSQIGATFGNVYCGPVGGVHRNEYAVMGPSVNLAARLMMSKENPGILVDHAVRRLASRSYSFNALSPVSAKGYNKPVHIFEPLTEIERPWGRIEPNFVGREEELKRIIKISKEMSSAGATEPRLVLISSSSGMGKSTLLSH